LIQIVESGVMKYVKRLSLLFNAEDPFKFRQRVEEAKQRQYTAEDEIRFYKYVDNLPNETVSSLSPEVNAIVFPLI
jgi:hypothetical protein